MAMASLGGNDTIALDGARKARGNMTQSRIRVSIVLLLAVFGVVAGRLIQLGNETVDTTIEGQSRAALTATRPPILDRNGLEMAVDIKVPSLYAEPRRIIDVDEAVEKLTSVMPDLDRQWLRNKLTGDKGFVWIKRELSPAMEEKILHLGIPGIDFITESKRFYPGGPTASHVLGSVNVDNQGIAGIEKYMDSEDVGVLQAVGLARGRALEPVNLSIDMRVQNVMRDQLEDALTRYKAIAASGVMLDVHTGEVLALVSLPDFDPNEPATALKAGRLNAITAGKFELGSVFKTMTIAGALESGKVKLTDSFDARFGVKFGRYTITDFHGKHRILTVPEVYKYSSNVGAIHIMQAYGKEAYRAFLHKMGFDGAPQIELPERTESNIPQTFSDVTAATAAFGHGISVTPMQMAVAISALVNGGTFIPATLFERTPQQALAVSHPVVSEATSERMRYLMRLNATDGSGSLGDKLAKGYRMGGKTGTAEKVENGRYAANKNRNVFASAFPMEAPKYAMVILVDEPKRENDHSGDTAGWNAGEVTGRIIARVAPMLGIAPNLDPALDSELVPPELR